MIRTLVNTNNAKEMLNEVFSDEVDSKCRGDRDTGLSGDFRQLVVALNEGYGLPRQDYKENEKLLFLRY